MNDILGGPATGHKTSPGSNVGRKPLGASPAKRAGMAGRVFLSG